MSPDPIGLYAGVNLFAYVGSNPVNNSDPLGLFQSPWYLSWVPGQHLFDRGMTALEEGRVGIAASYFAGMLTEQALTAATFGYGSAAKGSSSVCEYSVASKGITNEVPSTLARVVPGERVVTTLGRPGAQDVFLTAADDISGLNASQLSKRLAIDPSDTFTVIKFPTPPNGLATPINRLDKGFIGGGRTAGGAREFVLPNQPIPPGAIMEVVR